MKINEMKIFSQRICFDFTYRYGKFLMTEEPCFFFEIQEDLHTKLTRAVAERSDGIRTEIKKIKNNFLKI